MATSTYLANPTCTINSVDLQDQCKSAVLTQMLEAQESTAFGSAVRSYVAGLGNHTLTVELYQSYAASETYATLLSLVGTQVTVSVKPTSSATSATNPSFSLTASYLESCTVVNASIGELSTISITFQGGTYAAATS